MSGRMEQMIVHIDWVRDIAEGASKEAKARRDILANTIRPRMEALVDLCDADAQPLLDLTMLCVIARRVLTKSACTRFRGTQMATMDKYIRYILEEPILLITLFHPFEARARMMDGYATLRKLNERGLIRGVEHNQDLSFETILQSDRKTIKELIAREDRYLAGKAVEPLIAPLVIKDVEIRELSDARSLKVQGQKEHHCVAGYYGQVASGGCLILGMSGHGETSTVQIVIDATRPKAGNHIKGLCVAQHHARLNTSPSEAHERALAAWLQAANRAIEQAQCHGPTRVDGVWKTLVMAMDLPRPGNNFSPNFWFRRSEVELEEERKAA